jgi:hypothetical protein
MWNTPVPIFEDEDEDKLISEFVKLCALYPDREPFEITAYIFKDLRDPTMRANQAALVWSKDLEILERIRLAKLHGVNETPIDSKETKLRKLEAIYNDEKLALRERLKAFELHSQLQGEIKKPSDDEDEDVKRRPIFINYALDPRAAAANG